MGYKNDFFGSSLNEEDIKHISRWEVDRILSTVSTMQNEGRSKKHKISDREIDKILSEEFIPISKKEFNKNKNISDDNSEKSSDISVIRTKRQKKSAKQKKHQDNLQITEKDRQDMEKTKVINLNSDLKAEINANPENKIKTQDNSDITEKNMKPAKKNTPTAAKQKKKVNTSSLIMSVLSFICLALCIIICLSLVAIR
ncbi:MAG: hypothetical protein ACI4JM_06400 [Oscillospiraceae bacterium]